MKVLREQVKTGRSIVSIAMLVGGCILLTGAVRSEWHELDRQAILTSLLICNTCTSGLAGACNSFEHRAPGLGGPDEGNVHSDCRLNGDCDTCSAHCHIPGGCQFMDDGDNDFNALAFFGRSPVERLVARIEAANGRDLKQILDSYSSVLHVNLNRRAVQVRSACTGAMVAHVALTDAQLSLLSE